MRKHFLQPPRKKLKEGTLHLNETQKSRDEDGRCVPERRASSIMGFHHSHTRLSTLIEISSPKFTYHSKTIHTVLISSILLAFLLASLNPAGATIGCFKCFSVNGSNPACEDPFHNNFSSEYYESPCLCGRKGRNGLFPGTSCVKIKGDVMKTGKSILYRTCALDSGTQTTDTEIVRMSHCGRFEFDDEYVAGCVQSCNDADGCNSSRHLRLSPYHLVFLPVVQQLLLFFSARQSPFS